MGRWFPGLGLCYLTGQAPAVVLFLRSLRPKSVNRLMENLLIEIREIDRGLSH